MKILPVLILLSLAGAGSANETIALPWLGANLATNAGFETGPAGAIVPGWTAKVVGSGSVAAVTADSPDGRQALKLDMPGSPASIAVDSTPIAVEPGQAYLFSIASFRTGFNRLPGRQNKYEGVDCSARVIWLDKNRRAIGAVADESCAFPYSPSLWETRDTFVYAPPPAKFAVISICAGNDSSTIAKQTIPSTALIDAVQFREYRAFPTPDWAKRATPRVVEGTPEATPGRVHFVASSEDFKNYRGGKYSQMAIDPQAERGSALVAPTGVGGGVMACSPYYTALPAGLYRLRVRIKVSDNRSAVRAGCINISSDYSGQRLGVDIYPKTFAATNSYADLERDFILRDNGWWAILLWTDGNQEWAIDSIKVIPLCLLEDRQLLAVFPSMAEETPPALQPRRVAPYRVLALAGFGYDLYKLVPTLRMLAREVTIRTVWLKSGQYGSILMSDFPETAEELFDHNLIVMANTPSTMFSLRQKCRLRDYVRRGGALLVLGGMHAYGRGGLAGSLLEEVMPVEAKITTPEDTRFEPQGVCLEIAPGAPAWVQGFDYAAGPRAYYLHKSTLKPQAQLLVRAGGQPFLAGGDYGTGRVVCMLAMPFGNSLARQVAFWNWPDWPFLLRDAMWWAMRCQDE